MKETCRCEAYVLDIVFEQLSRKRSTSLQDELHRTLVAGSHGEIDAIASSRANVRARKSAKYRIEPVCYMMASYSSVLSIGSIEAMTMLWMYIGNCYIRSSDAWLLETGLNASSSSSWERVKGLRKRRAATGSGREDEAQKITRWSERISQVRTTTIYRVARLRGCDNARAVYTQN